MQTLFTALPQVEVWQEESSDWGTETRKEEQDTRLSLWSTRQLYQPKWEYIGISVLNFLLEFGILESRTLMKLGPNQYKMVIKNKAGKTGGYEMKFAEHGMFLTAHVGDLTATGFYR